MATIRELRIKARKLGITNFRDLDEDELEDAIKKAKKAKNGSGSKKSGKSALKAVKNKEKKRGPGRPRKVRDDDDDEDEKPKKRGRPKGSTNKTTTTRKNKSEDRPKRRGRPPKAETERKSSRKSSNGVGRPRGSGNGTRVLVPERIKWNRDFDFRDGSTAQYILNELRRAAKKHDETADIREAVIDKLEDKINKVDELTFNNRSTGRPHKGAEAEKMLRLRVNQVILNYCIETDQHDSDGGSTTTTKKRSAKSETSTPKKRGRPRKVRDDDDEDDDDRPKRGRPKGSKNKTTTTKKKPGRPKGSKNKK